MVRNFSFFILFKARAEEICARHSTCRWPTARPPRSGRLPPAEHRRRTERRLRSRLELVQLRLER